MKPTHEQIRAYLHLGREQLKAGEQAALDTHLADCADCRAYAAEVAAFQARLGRLMRLRWDRYQPSPALNGQIQTRLKWQQRRRRFWQFSGSALATAALLVLVVALGWLVGRVGSLPERPAGSTVTTVALASPPPEPVEGGLEGGQGGVATFGNNLRLLAYTLEDNPIPIGSQTSATFYWQAGDLAPGYKLFIHILDSNDNLVAQTDLPLDQNRCPETPLLSQGLVATCLPLSLPVAPGQYQVVIGVYEAATGQRLATETGETAVQLTTITVVLPPGEPPATPTALPTCPVTRPNGNPPPGEIPSPDHHGNGVLWTVLPPDGRALVPPEGLQADGTLSLDWPWWQWKEGQLTLTGRRLGPSSASLLANIIEGNEERGPQSSELLFPAEGCWEITGKVGAAELTFVILVEKTQ